MNRRLTVATATLAALSLSSAVPALAAKPKPKPITMTYKVQLVPDYSINEMDGCSSVVPAAQDKRMISLPAKGTLKVVLDGEKLPTPALPQVGTGDWDLYTLDANGDVSSAGESAEVHEETLDKVKGKTTMSIWVCNLSGATNGTVTWTFTYA